MSQSSVHVFIPLIPCREGNDNRVVFFIPPSLGNIDVKRSLVYMKGVAPKLGGDCNNIMTQSSLHLELYFTGNLCHRLYGILAQPASSTQQPTSTLEFNLRNTDLIFTTDTTVGTVRIYDINLTPQLHTGVRGDVKAFTIRDENSIVNLPQLRSRLSNQNIIQNIVELFRGRLIYYYD